MISTKTRLPRPSPLAEAALDDAEIIVRSRSDATEFAALFDRHYGKICAYLRWRAGRDVGEELAAETFLRALDSLDSYDPSQRSALPWLYGIASNLLGKHYRRESRRLKATARLAMGERHDDQFQDVDRRISSQQSAPLIAKTLAGLNKRDRDAFLLCCLEGLTYEETSRALGIPVGTVRSRVNRTRNKLRISLKENGGA